MPSTYQRYQKLFKGQSFPLAYVDLDLLDANIRSIQTQANGMPIRIASKSVRSIEMLRYISQRLEKVAGIMAFAPAEALLLSRRGFHDILLAYPSVDVVGLRQMYTQKSAEARIVCMVDSISHLEVLQLIANEEKLNISICIDLDCSTDFPALHFGVWRSPLRSIKALRRLIDTLGKYNRLSVAGLMGYEAQIAGLGEQTPGQPVKNQLIRFLKKQSIPALRKRREKAVRLLQQFGFDLSFVNGGGTGSIASTIQEPDITEITVGSGFYSPHLFDYYEDFQFEPAAGYAIQVTRIPRPHLYTCYGGGYPASGALDASKSPKVYLPQGAKLDPQEGAGEVQTPVHYRGPENLQIGDPIFLRHAKAGELCERFNTLYLIRGEQIVDRVATYRGEGYMF